MKKRNIKGGKVVYRELRIVPDTYDATKRTIDVTFATDTPVLRFDWRNDAYYNEVLSFDKGNVRMERMNLGAPVLNSHNSGGLENMLGAVVKAWVADGQGRATLIFSERDEVAGFVKDIQAGIIKNVSAGYRVYKYEVTEGENGEPGTKRAVDWEPFEVSMVPIPADMRSQTRKDKLKIDKKRTMAKPTKETEGKKVLTPAQKEERRLKIEARNAEIAQEAKEKERKRITKIRNMCKEVGIKSREFIDTMVTKEVSVVEARKIIFEKLAKDQKEIRGNVKIVGPEEKEKRATAIEDAIIHRANPHLLKADKLTEGAKEYRNLNMLALCRTILEDAGIKTRGLSDMEIARTALMGTDMSGRAYHAISDFPIILGNTINRTLRMAYDLAPRTFMPFCRQTTAKDFRPMTRVQMGDVSAFDQIKENEEYKQGTFGEAKEVYSVFKYGKKFALSWEMLINDDLSAFNRIPMSVAQQAAQKQSDIVWGILTANAAMADTVDLFHTTHANLGTTAAITIDSLAEARKLMRKQKSIGGNYLNISPEYLLVAPSNEQAAYQYTSINYVPVDPTKINPDYNTNLKTIVEPRLEGIGSGKTWFMAASPNAIDTIEFAFLEGDGELFTENRLGFDVDGLEIKARMVFGAKAIDWRGLVKNVGA